MNTRQLNAINYARLKRQEEQDRKTLIELGLYEVYLHQSIYLRKRTFLNAEKKRSDKFKKAVSQGTVKYITSLIGVADKDTFAAEVDRIYKIQLKYGMITIAEKKIKER